MPDKKWDIRFLEMAQLISTWSKDPSTKCGAVIVRPDRTIVSTGYNGFPRHISDQTELYQDRDEKMKRVVHAEMNAILSASESVRGCCLIEFPGMSCDRCAVHIIQAGISRLVYPAGHKHSPDMNEDLASKLFREAGVKVIDVDFINGIGYNCGMK